MTLQTKSNAEKLGDKAAGHTARVQTHVFQLSTGVLWNFLLKTYNQQVLHLILIVYDN